jgi:hypothetical protein
MESKFCMVKVFTKLGSWGTILKYYDYFEECQRLMVFMCQETNKMFWKNLDAFETWIESTLSIQKCRKDAIKDFIECLIKKNKDECYTYTDKSVLYLLSHRMKFARFHRLHVLNINVFWKRKDVLGRNRENNVYDSLLKFSEYRDRSSKDHTSDWRIFNFIEIKLKKPHHPQGNDALGKEDDWKRIIISEIIKKAMKILFDNYFKTSWEFSSKYYELNGRFLELASEIDDLKEKSFTEDGMKKIIIDLSWFQKFNLKKSKAFASKLWKLPLTQLCQTLAQTEIIIGRSLCKENINVFNALCKNRVNILAIDQSEVNGTKKFESSRNPEFKFSWTNVYYWVNGKIKAAGCSSLSLWLDPAIEKLHYNFIFWTNYIIFNEEVNAKFVWMIKHDDFDGSNIEKLVSVNGFSIGEVTLVVESKNVDYFRLGYNTLPCFFTANIPRCRHLEIILSQDMNFYYNYINGKLVTFYEALSEVFWIKNFVEKRRIYPSRRIDLRLHLSSDITDNFIAALGTLVKFPITDLWISVTDDFSDLHSVLKDEILNSLSSLTTVRYLKIISENRTYRLISQDPRLKEVIYAVVKGVELP